VTSQHRSLRQAAEALNIRQSTLSRRLHEIHPQIGVVLFERTKGGTNLTTVGREFVASATRTLDGVETELRFSSSHNESPGLVQGGGGTSRSYPVLPRKAVRPTRFMRRRRRGLGSEPSIPRHSPNGVCHVSQQKNCARQ
jgi:DNA-binding transcriptional LysR family regulator